MSDAKKCDRCFSFYDPYKPDIALLNVHLTSSVDLCPVCNDALESWLYLKPKEAKDEPEEEQSSGNDNI